MWMTNDGQWKIEVVTTHQVQCYRVWHWSDKLNDWKRHADASTVEELQTHVDISTITEYPKVPDVGFFVG